MFRVLTISREFGSGGAAIGRRVSEQLGWRFLDKEFVENIASSATVNPRLARQLDERKENWLKRLSRQLWKENFVEGAVISTPDFFDSDTMAVLARNLIEEAYRQGNCVIVGRGAQCVLQDRKDVFHVFVYAPWEQRVACIRQRMPETKDIEEVVRETDRQRADYIRTYLVHDWMDPHLYQLMICSCLGEDWVISTIVGAMTKSVACAA